MVLKSNHKIFQISAPSLDKKKLKITRIHTIEIKLNMLFMVVISFTYLLGYDFVFEEKKSEEILVNFIKIYRNL